MPLDKTIRRVLVIGSGPIVIGQACEFDYSGTQACKALREEGVFVILVNSNPATIMTDPETADKVYIEPINSRIIERIIEQERPDALLPTMGGQTALNMAMELEQSGILEKYSVRMIGADTESINKAEDRDVFRGIMRSLGIRVPISHIIGNIKELHQIKSQLNLPLIIRPSFTLGGSGGSIVRSWDDLDSQVTAALAASPVQQALLEESILGWKEYELEVMRDKEDNVVIVCSIENIDPMGVHTGDSITVAPAQTLTDREYQHLRDLSIKIIRAIGVETGGSNIQFAVNPEDGAVVVIEMNPRVSRSSALASKATGFPIAKIAAKLALGYCLYELPNDITGKTKACFEPSIDYVVTKIPRFAFEKFPHSGTEISLQMKSVGEVMAIGRTFEESLQKALCSMELDLSGLDPILTAEQKKNLKEHVTKPTSERLRYIADALRGGWNIDYIHELSKIDPWFIEAIAFLIKTEADIKSFNLNAPDALQKLLNYKRQGFSDKRIANLCGLTEQTVREFRWQNDIRPRYKVVDTCAGEFEALTPYYYSCYEDQCEAVRQKTKPRVIVLGSGPNRIGQGIEFDYCCVHAALELKEQGYDAIMVNCNPETVSTDYDTSTRLYLEPITAENVLEIVELEQPIGVVVQFGGQTPLKLAQELDEAGVRLLGTTREAIELTEDRSRFAELITQLGLNQPANALVYTYDQLLAVAKELGYPLMIRPSYVLGGRAMEIAHSEDDLEQIFNDAARIMPQHPVLVDKFIENAHEVDVDVLTDGKSAVAVGIMEHIERAGVHSGDSACSLPCFSIPEQCIKLIKQQSEAIALKVGIKGLLNIQYAVSGETIYILEVNPRASRTVPFVSKVFGIHLARYATRLMLGEPLANISLPKAPQFAFSVKETVLPFAKFPQTDLLLGPEMRSTGEVMGSGNSFSEAFLKSQIAANGALPSPPGYVFIGVRDEDKERAVALAKKLLERNFGILATDGTARRLELAGIKGVKTMHFKDTKVFMEYVVSQQIKFVINTTHHERKAVDVDHLRRICINYGISCCSTIEAAEQFVEALHKLGCSIDNLSKPTPIHEQRS